MSSQEVYVLSGVRSPIGTLSGGLSSLPAHSLGSSVIQEGLKRAGVKGDAVSEVFMGQILTAGCGQNPARQASMKADIPKEVPSTTLNMLCGSGLKAVALGYQAIRSGDASVIVAGGQESMSQSAHCVHMRNGVKFGDTTLTDTMVKDGLTDAFYDYHMGITAENVAKQFNIVREDQDIFAAESQRRVGVALKNNSFSDEIVPITVQSRKGATVVAKDEFPRPDTTPEALGKLRPAFVKDGSGSVTAGNASGINDGAAVVILASQEFVASSSSKPLARIVSWAQAGVDPSVMGMGPVPAIQRALSKAKWTVADVDLFELNEAFAAQSLAVIRELHLDTAKVNVGGGAIALGHPIGASGCRILVTLLYALKRTGGKRGVASLCIGGGMGIAVCVELL